ncbi:hypothetical protein SAMN02746065_10629 [Desulfocicer vacuolatum DSM 3385]|uniref:Uncharacterized protein n=1 Tax=Desulfocicer vacuolatum DSM 3385 TaxID=1121400 RepID=A0A1W2AQL3_9BACT|nr:hypothetical protein [Desulfocicer vacuolatum]SMC63029.1 hypothetical protein SAMN02746065_10629 [Desulfocicer vacuolatum DSM 3385]
MKIKKYIADPFLEKRIVNYDKWLSKGQISASSKVIPVSESLNAKQWVLPTEQVIEILGMLSGLFFLSLMTIMGLEALLESSKILFK